MRQKLFKKYFAATAIIILFSFSAILLILSFVYNNYLAEEKYKVLKKSCDSVCEFIEIAYTQEEFTGSEYDIYYIMNNVADVSEFDIYITDIYGTIKICGCAEWGAEGFCGHTGSQIKSDVLSSIISENGQVFDNMGIYSMPHYATATEIKASDGKIAGYIVAADSINDIIVLMKSITKLYLLSAIFPIALMFFALYFMTYKLTRPLKLMSEAAKAMAKGDFSKRIPVTSDDEIGELAVSFNQMTNSLTQLEDMRKNFVANISHEFRTPMTTIGGFIDGIIDGTIEPEKQNYYLQIVSEEVKRLSRMVQSMLSLARLESGEVILQPENFDLREMVLNVVISQEQRIEQKKLNISGLDEMQAVSVTADKDLIHRAIYNLVDNAIKFTDESGTITFVLKALPKGVTFNIKNTGKGIPKNELPFVFDRFYKADKSRSSNKTSTGLGLYMVKTIIKNHNGTINVSSVENSFTAFEFTLPVK